MKDPIQIIKELDSLSPYTDQRIASEIRQDAQSYLNQASQDEVNSPLGMMIRNRL